MNKTTVVKLNRIKKLNFDKYTVCLLTVFGISIISILFGSLFLKCSDGRFSDFISDYFVKYYNVRCQQSFWIKFIGCAKLWIFFFALMYLSGTSLIGIVAGPMILGTFCFLYGATAGFLYKTYSINGIVLCLLVIILPRAICIFALIICSRESINLSLALSSVTINQSHTGNVYMQFRLYSIRYLLLLLVLIVASLLDCAFSSLFIRYFNF